LARVPVDTRLRCCEVSAGWNDFLASELSLWTALDLSDTSGVTHKVTNALLRAAAANSGRRADGIERAKLSALVHVHGPAGSSDC
jgi:hypothetical protein